LHSFAQQNQQTFFLPESLKIESDESRREEIQVFLYKEQLTQRFDNFHDCKLKLLPTKIKLPHQLHIDTLAWLLLVIGLEVVQETLRRCLRNAG
jgi:hypothetical protein